MAEHDDDFAVETTDSGASKSMPIQTSTLKKGSHLLIKGRPCKVDSISTSKPGKHGSAKCHIVAIDIFTGKKMEEISPAHATLHAPYVKRKEYSLFNIDDGFMEGMDNNDVMKDDIRVPDNDLGESMTTMFEKGLDVQVTVISAMGEEMIIDVKEANK